jgi:glycosyltransferase involved in cell wall biosynthesis
LSDNGYRCLVITSDVNEAMALKSKKLVEGCGRVKACIVNKSPIDIPFISRWLLAQKIRLNLKEIIGEFDPTHIYTRSVTVFGAASRIAKTYKLKHIHDVRGISSIESMFQQTYVRGKIYFHGLNFLEKHALNNADRLSCVSHQMGSWIKNRCGREDYTVIPCCVLSTDNGFDMHQRLDMRNRLGFTKNCKVICYLGDLAKWQNIDNILTLFKNISKINPDSKFLFISPNSKILLDKIKSVGLESGKCHFVTCKQSEVMEYLKASDAGIIMRDDTLINNVACPVKIGEYLNAGLPVLLTRNIGDMSELIEKNRVGLIIEDKNPSIEEISMFINSNSYEESFYKCKTFVREYLTWDRYLEEFKILYK